MLGWWGLLSRYGGCDDTAGSERSTGWLASWMVRRLVGWLAGKGVASWRRRCRRSKRESVPRKGAFSRRASLPEDTYTPVDTRLSNRTPLPSSVAICLLPARGTHQCVTNWMDSSWEVTSPSLLFLFLFFSFFFNFFRFEFFASLFTSAREGGWQRKGGRQVDGTTITGTNCQWGNFKSV